MSDIGDDGNEPDFQDDFEEPAEEFEEEPTFTDNEEEQGGDTGPNGVINGDHDNYISSGDPAAAAAAAEQQQGAKKVEDKKIPNDERNTTPYMTKYERARLLGTRALQIRWDSIERPLRRRRGV
jgi:DNA-directed RNA polymerase I, II, and III subunit RPABC2